MSDVKRYTVVECHNDEEFWAKMKEVKHGDYVLYSDYTELEQQKAELIEIAREYSYLLSSQQTYDFNNEHDLKRGEDIDELLRKYTEGER